MAPSPHAEPLPRGGSTGPRTQQFLRSALAIVGETGRTDFTVLEVVERSGTSLRAFYQHFTTKDDLLLAVVEQLVVDSTAQWRGEMDSMAADQALRRLVARMSAPADSPAHEDIIRAVTAYNDRLVRTRPREYATVLVPLYGLLVDILSRGVGEGVFRADIDVEIDAAIMLHTLLGALRLRELGSELNGRPVDGAHLYAFCARNVLSADENLGPGPAPPS